MSNIKNMDIILSLFPNKYNAKIHNDIPNIIVFYINGKVQNLQIGKDKNGYKIYVNLELIQDSIKKDDLILEVNKILSVINGITKNFKYY